MIVFEHWFTYTTALNFTRFKGIFKAFSGMCVRFTSITFPVIWSSVLTSVTWVALVTFFRINNIELKCSFVWCRKYHKSWSNGAAELCSSAEIKSWHDFSRNVMVAWPRNWQKSFKLWRDSESKRKWKRQKRKGQDYTRPDQSHHR